MSAIDVGEAAGLPMLWKRVREWARTARKKEAIVHEGERLSFSSLDRLVDKRARQLAAMNLGANAHVILFGHASIDYIASYVALDRLGLASVPLATWLNRSDLAAMIHDSDATLILCEADVWGRLPPLPTDLSVVDMHISRHLESGANPVLSSDPDPSAICSIVYTSGTTGRPKGIVHTFGTKAQRLLNPMTAQSADDINVVTTPIYTSMSLTAVVQGLVWGATTHLVSKFDARGLLELIEKERVTFLPLVPTQLRRILEIEDLESYDLSSVRSRVSGSATLSREMKADLLRRWPGPLLDIYTQSEAGATTTLAVHENPEKLHTVGKPMSWCDVRVIDANDREVARGETGEIVGRQGASMAGYYKRPEESAAAFWVSSNGDRYVRTGDLGRFDDDGYLEVVGRKKDVIISGGVNLYPADLEAALLSHPVVSDAAVVAAPSERWGETPVAFVILRPRATPASEIEILEWANARLGRFQRIHRLSIVDEFPRSPFGKVLKRELRDLAAA